MTTQNYTDKFKEAFVSKVMSDVTRYIIEKYFEAINTGTESETIASLFSKNVNFYIPGDVKQTYGMGNGYGKAISYIQDLRLKMKSIAFNIKSIDIEGEEAAVLTELTARQRKTGETINKEFFFQFTVHNGQITRFRTYQNYATADAITDHPEEQEYVELSD